PLAPERSLAHRADQEGQQFLAHHRRPHPSSTGPVVAFAAAATGPPRRVLCPGDRPPWKPKPLPRATLGARSQRPAARSTGPPAAVDEFFLCNRHAISAGS